MNPIVQALITKAEAALRGVPLINGSVLVNLGTAGLVYFYPNNEVAAVPEICQADAVLTLSLDTLEKIENNQESVLWADIWGDLKVDGNEDLAIKLGKILQAALTT